MAGVMARPQGDGTGRPAGGVRMGLVDDKSYSDDE